MFTYSFSWKSWKSNKIIAPGQEIKDYLTRAAEEEGNKYRSIIRCLGLHLLFHELLISILIRYYGKNII